MAARVGASEIEQRVQHFVGLARGAGLRLTPQRLEIFRAVASRCDHPDAETVFRAVRGRLPTVSLDTVYRTLHTLEAIGALGVLGPRRDRVRFDANLGPHHHFVCERCGATEDFTSAELDALPVPDVARRLGDVRGIYVEVRGLCPRCTKGR